jgi:hypothetical protein
MSKTATKKRGGMPPVEKRPLDPRLHKWFSKPEAADYIGISLQSFRRLIEPDPKTGKRAVPTYRPVPGRAMFKREDLDAAMESRRDAEDA